MVLKVFSNANPPYSVEISLQGALGDVVCRVDLNNDRVYEGWIGFLDDFGGWDQHLLTMLQKAGRTDITTPLAAVQWIQSRPKAEVDAVIANAWREILKIISEMVNKYWKRAGADTPPPSTGSYQNGEEVFAALLARAQHTEDTDGKAVLILP